MEYAGLVKSARANDVVIVFNFCGVNVVDFLVAVILTDPFRRAVVHNFPLDTRLPYIRIRCTNSETRIILAASNDFTFHASRLLLVRGLLREHCRRQREGKRQHQQHCELLLQHVSSPLDRRCRHRPGLMCNKTTRSLGPKRATSFKSNPTAVSLVLVTRICCPKDQLSGAS